MADKPSDKNEIEVYEGMAAIDAMLAAIPAENKVISIYDTANIPDPITLDDLLKRNIPPQQYVLHPILPVQGIGFIYAATGLGKTLFALNLAYAIANGGNFLSYKAGTVARKVMYVDGEMPLNQIQDRATRIHKVQGKLDNSENFLLINSELLYPYGVPKIDTIEGQAVYLKWIETYQVEVIIFDNLSMLSSIDENKSHEWCIVQDFILRLRAMGKSIFIVHHAGKEKSGYRGTSRMLDCADVAISLQAVDNNASSEDEIHIKKFKVVYQKARHFGGVAALPFEITLENDCWKHNSTHETDKMRIIELYNLGMNHRQIAKELNLHESTVYRRIKEAERKKLVRTSKKSRSQTT